VAADPDIGAVLSELVETSAGHEIYLRRPEHLGLDMRKPATFETVCYCASSAVPSAAVFSGALATLPMPLEIAH
jgi:hypothetical protein